MPAWFARIRSLVVVAAALTLIACGGPTFIVQQYDGPPRPPETVAILRVNGTDAAQLASLDGDSANAGVAEDARLHVEVLPGSHTVWVRNAAAPSEPPQRLQFMAEAGRVYRPVLTVARNAGADKAIGAIARIYEVDRGSDALLRDVTVGAPVPAPGPPPATPSEPAPSPYAPSPIVPEAPAPEPMPAPMPPPAPDPASTPPATPLPAENPPRSSAPLGPEPKP